ncbi:hypothetical protein A2G06_16760 (plasmid) [Geobacter anodireducens]|nr:hypothetical protein A2G06_16760 [Geobacter anodireducens]
MTNEDMKEIAEFLLDVARHFERCELGGEHAVKARILAERLSVFPTEKEMELIQLLRKRGLDPIEEVKRYAAEHNISFS